MSVESAKTDTSNESLTDIKKLGSLSLAVTNENGKNLNMNDLSPSFTQLLQDVKVESPTDLTPDNDSQNSFIDAVLTGMFSEFAEQEAKSGVKTTLADAINFSDNLFNNLSFNFKMESPTGVETNESRGNTLDQSAFFHRSVSAPGDNEKPQEKQKQRKSRLKSDTTFESRSRKSPYKKSGRPSRASIDSQLDEETSAFQIRSPGTRNEDGNPDKKNNSKSSRMYFENKDYFKLRLHLRELTRLQTQTEVLKKTPGQLLMKSSKLFLNLLTKKHEWVLNSVTAAVKNDKEIDMKNFTKRKITIHNDISADHVSRFC